jgi:hypothetical protein
MTDFPYPLQRHCPFPSQCFHVAAHRAIVWLPLWRGISGKPTVQTSTPLDELSRSLRGKRNQPERAIPSRAVKPVIESARQI